MTKEEASQEYAMLCTKLGDLIIRGEINDRQMEETKEKLHNIQVKAKKLFEAAPVQTNEEPTPETVQQ